MSSHRLPLAEAISILLEDIIAVRHRRSRPVAKVAISDRLQALDLFEMMIRVDDVASQAGLSGSCPELERWAELDPDSLGARLATEPGGLVLAVLLLLSARALGRVAPQISFLRWMELTRALNHITQPQLAALRSSEGLERYLLGTAARPDLNFPWVFPLPLPSVLRVIQSTRFRLGLLRPEGQAEAWRRYARFFND